MSDQTLKNALYFKGVLSRDILQAVRAYEREYEGVHLSSIDIVQDQTYGVEKHTVAINITVELD